MAKKLYPYQQQVAQLLLEGKNVILQAPTGAGKTLAALLPFINAWEHQREFPRKCIYSVPMRVLANQFYEEYEDIMRKYNFQRPMEVKIQTGEHRDDSRFEGDLIFATIDQTLSSFLMAPYSLPRRLSNLNAGAVAAAYLVFDEFHLFEPTSTLPTTLEMLKMLGGAMPFLLMTATFSASMLAGLARQLNAVVVPEDAAARQAMQAIPSQDKTRTYHVAEDTLDAEAVLAHHTHRSLVVCNVVDRARRLFEALRAHPDRGETQVILLHSRFLPQDRQRIEDRVRSLFAQGNRAGRWIAVATQAIEVGLNITCEQLHTELAPANAILQRAGRCARYAGETGHVHIYPRTVNPRGEVIDLTESAWPYQDQRATIGRTLDAFRGHACRPMAFAEEQDVVSLAHGPDDQLTLIGLEATQTGHRDAMAGVMSGRQDAGAAQLIRAVSSQLVVIHDQPDALLERPFSAESFSLHPGTVQGQVAAWAEAGHLAPDRVHILRDAGDADESGGSSYRWQPVRRASELKGAALVLLHPELAGYDPDLGLLLGQDTGFRSGWVETPGPAWTGGSFYRLEPYTDHVQRVYQAFETRIWPTMAESVRRLERALGWDAGIIERAMRLVVLLHDVGKLHVGWQRWVQAYQHAIGAPAQEDEVYAHTDYDATDGEHRRHQQAIGRRPSHAVEGATAVAPLLLAGLDALQPLVVAAFTAIARHHGAFTRQGQPYRLVATAPQVIADTLTQLPVPVRQAVDVRALWISQHPAEEVVGGLLVDAGHKREMLPYMLLSRALRLADQWGTQEGTK